MKNNLIQHELLYNPWEIWIETSDDPCESPSLYIFGDIPLDDKRKIPVLQKRNGTEVKDQLHLELVFTSETTNASQVEVVYSETLEHRFQYNELFIHMAGQLAYYQKSFDQITYDSDSATYLES